MPAFFASQKPPFETMPPPPVSTSRLTLAAPSALLCRSSISWARGEAGAEVAVRPRFEPCAIGVERRVSPRLFGDSEGLGELFVCRGGEPRGIFEQACDRGVVVSHVVPALMHHAGLFDLGWFMPKVDRADD